MLLAYHKKYIYFITIISNKMINIVINIKKVSGVKGLNKEYEFHKLQLNKHIR